jgi:hypothetical protein
MLERRFAGWALHVAIAVVFGPAIAILAFCYYYVGSFESELSPLEITREIAFLILCSAPILLIAPIGYDVVRGPARAGKLVGHVLLFAVILSFNPILERVSGLDRAYAEKLRDQAQRLYVVGKTQEEVIALLGSPSYVNPIDGVPGVVQLRYRHPFPMLDGAEFFVEVRDGRAQTFTIDPGEP